jgi:hypothetical protein
MRINSAGNVGIGTTAPLYQLTVAKSTGTTIGITTNLQAGTIGSPLNTDLDFIGYNNTQINARIRSWDESGSTGHGYLTFWTNNGTTVAEKMRINSAGNVGIGNTDASYKVDVGTSNNGNHVRARGTFLHMRQSFAANVLGSRVIRFTVVAPDLQFVNIFFDIATHKYNDGGAWQQGRYAVQFMQENSNTVRLNQRMPNYEYAGSTSGVFTFPSPPIWIATGNSTFYFDLTIAQFFSVGGVSITVEGPGAKDVTVTQVS